jgi:hypothetical protein
MSFEPKIIHVRTEKPASILTFLYSLLTILNFLIFTLEMHRPRQSVNHVEMED